MKKIINILFCCLPVFILSQTVDNVNGEDIQAQEVTAKAWIASLYEMGMEMTEDSIKMSGEFQKLMDDEVYRNQLYPEVYTWQEALQLLQANQLKIAFWHFINLYPKNEVNKELVVKSILAYDQLLKMDEVLVATFYTYSFADPEVSIFKDGKPEIVRPDILEAKLRSVKEIVGYIRAYRVQLAEKGD